MIFHLLSKPFGFLMTCLPLGGGGLALNGGGGKQCFFSEKVKIDFVKLYFLKMLKPVESKLGPLPNMNHQIRLFSLDPGPRVFTETLLPSSAPANV